MTNARNKFKWAYRSARVEAQINWAPDHVDPEDIDPVKFQPGGQYYNSPQIVAAYKATRPWETDYKGPKYDLEIYGMGRTALNMRMQPGMVEQNAERVRKMKYDRDWEAMWGGAGLNC